ncbi:MAG: hypothetical protein HRT89_04025 [Lentisphaeria bacterium]|nr:SprT-like domain-containing protein [Lentisphaeria bacterium]NQZ67218.1 hypothetical protein [Lentisphaeria bacterium]
MLKYYQLTICAIWCIYAPSCIARDVYRESFHLASDLVTKKFGFFKAPSLKVGPISTEELKALNLPIPVHSIHAFYDASHNVIYIDPKRFSAYLLRKVKSNTERRSVILSTLVHEMIHAYQFSILGDGYKKKDKLFLRFLCEGHAVEMTAIICTKKDMPKRLIKLGSPTRTNRHFGSNYAKNLNQNMLFFYYTLGAKFTKKCLESKISFGDMTKLKINLQLAFAVADKKFFLSKEIRARQLFIRNAISVICANKGKKFNYIEAGTFLTPGRLSNKKSLLGFDQALGWKVGKVEILLVSFSSATIAADVFLHHRKFVSKFKLVIEKKDASKTDDIWSANYPNKGITSLVILLENCIVVVSSNTESSAQEIAEKIREQINIKREK